MANASETESDFQTEEFENTNFAFHLCIICQKEKNETLVEKKCVRKSFKFHRGVG